MNEVNEWCGNCDSEQLVMLPADASPYSYEWTCRVCGMEIETQNDDEVAVSIGECWIEDAAQRARVAAKAAAEWATV